MKVCACVTYVHIYTYIRLDNNAVRNAENLEH